MHRTFIVFVLLPPLPMFVRWIIGIRTVAWVPTTMAGTRMTPPLPHSWILFYVVIRRHMIVHMRMGEWLNRNRGVSINKRLCKHVPCIYICTIGTFATAGVEIGHTVWRGRRRQHFCRITLLPCSFFLSNKKQEKKSKCEYRFNWNATQLKHLPNTILIPHCANLNFALQASNF